MGRSEITKDIILDAFEDYVLEVGAANFTLEGVAKHAKISKGGLLYHFPSKKDLLRELIERAVTVKFKKRDEIAKTLPHTPEKMLKAHVIAWLNNPDGKNRLFTSIMTIMSHYPEFLDAVEVKYNNAVEIYCRKGMNKTMVDIIMLAVDGFLVHNTIKTGMFTQEEIKALEEKLLLMCEKAVLV
jgi:AcrR family transcriptional regulator